MNDPAAIAETFFNQAKAAVKAQHDGYQLMATSQKSMIDSMRSMGLPFQLASEQFGKMQEFEAQQHAAMMKHMDQMYDEWKKAVAQGVGGKK